MNTKAADLLQQIFTFVGLDHSNALTTSTILGLETAKSPALPPIIQPGVKIDLMEAFSSYAGAQSDVCECMTTE